MRPSLILSLGETRSGCLGSSAARIVVDVAAATVAAVVSLMKSRREVLPVESIVQSPVTSWERSTLGAQASLPASSNETQSRQDACAPRRQRSQAAVARLLKAYYYPRAVSFAMRKSHELRLED